MRPIDVTIEASLLDVYADIRLGCMHFAANVRPPERAFWEYMDGEVLPEVRCEIEGKAWSEIPGVRGSRLAYKAFGRDPGRYRVSSEALLRRVRRGDALYQVNSVVDVNNLLSVRSGLSVGSYDAARIHAPVTLRKAGGGEGYTGIGKGFLNLENLLVLADTEGPFGSSMSDSTRTMVTEETKEVLLVVYCLEQDIDLDAVLRTGSEALRRFAGVDEVQVWSI